MCGIAGIIGSNEQNVKKCCRQHSFLDKTGAVSSLPMIEKTMGHIDAGSWYKNIFVIRNKLTRD